MAVPNRTYSFPLLTLTIPENARPLEQVLLQPELVHIIAQFLAPRERHHARRISKAFHRAFQPYISLELAHTLLTRGETLSIPLEQVPTCGQLVRKYSTTFRAPADVKYNEEALAVLHTALNHCANVKELCFSWNSLDVLDLETVLDVFPSLTSLSITIATLKLKSADPILTILARSNLRHLRTLTLSNVVAWCQIGEWALVEDLLDACPSLCDLTLTRWPSWRLKPPTQDSAPHWYLTTDDVKSFKSYPQLNSLRLNNIVLTGKGLIFLSHCFPELHLLEIDRGHFSWTDPVFFRLNNTNPKATSSTTTAVTPNDPEPGPGAKFLNLTHLRQLKVCDFNQFNHPWHPSLTIMIKQMPHLSSLQIDHIIFNVPNFREMVLHCSKPEVDQSIQRLWIMLDMKGRYTHREVQGLLRQSCFRHLKELRVEKERILADVKTGFQLPFSSTLTTLRLGLPRVRFDDLTLSNLNRVVFPNLPNLEVLILDCRLHGFDLFRGLGYCPADEQLLPKVAYCGTFGVYPDKVPTPPSDVATPDLKGVPGPEDPAVVKRTTSMDRDLSTGAPLTEDTTVKDFVKKPLMIYQEWKYGNGALRHLRELEVSFASSYSAHMSDIDSQLIQRFPALECLTIKSKKVHGYEEWRREAKQQENLRLSMMTIKIKQGCSCV
ncbi:hypothetical protein BGZ94_010166 [Podila epigama]|nr:hypothetical protein BGZ94_010166 [Podila epigama]